MKLYIGLMSGTSMDGIDAALVDVETQQLIHGITMPYSTVAYDQLNQFNQHVEHSWQKISEVNTLIGQNFASAVQELLAVSGVSHEDIIAIGSHGQTVAHDALAETPYTVQLGCAHTIAQMTGIDVVADFRTRDMVVGGQGAPLAPLYHQVLFSAFEHPVAVVNVGGIANISLLQDDGRILGYDVGPGNCLMDAWVKQHMNVPYDKGGEWALQGQIIEPLLDDLMQDAFVQNAAPKSIGKEYYSLNWLLQSLREDYAAVDVQRTLLQYTALVITKAIKETKCAVRQVLICGGGAHNYLLLAEISRLIQPIPVNSTADFGINPDFIEAQMMAWLAEQMVEKKPLNLEKITGAKQKTILGVFYPAGIDN